jgi:OFA family oxalate/formate antiporter-like MFS transporter
MSCGVLVAAGFMLASRITTLAGFYLCYSCCAGFGTGLAYNGVISGVTRWFPEKPGFISGLLLAGFGTGGMVLGTLCAALIKRFGWQSAFMGIALVCFVSAVFCSAVLGKPPKEAYSPPRPGSGKRAGDEKAQDVTTGKMAGDLNFWLLFVWAACLSAGGLALIGHAAPFAVDMGLDVSLAAFYAGLVSVCNGAGRLLFGFLFDRIGRRLTMSIVASGFVLASAVLLAAVKTGSVPLLAAGCICTGLSYGGIMPCNSTVVGIFYGQKYYPANFSIITMNLLIASPLGPFVSGVLRQSSGSYISSLGIMAVFGITAFALGFIIRRKRFSEA